MKLLTSVLALAALGTLGAVAQIADTYETHNWTESSNALQLIGYNSAHVDTGTQALQVRFDGSEWGGVVATSDLITEVGTGLSSGLSVRVYCEAEGGSTGVPSAKLEVISESDVAMGGADTPLTLNAWTTVTLPAGSVTADYKRVQLVPLQASSTGAFNLWFDNLQREAVRWDDFEGTSNTRVLPANISGPNRGERTLGGGTTVVPGPAPAAGLHAYGMSWSGDADGTVEIQHFYSGVDLSAQNSVVLRVYVPSGTSLPTVNAFFWDGSNGSPGFTGQAITANDVWQTVTINISAMHGAPPFDDTSVDEFKVVCSGAGAAGTIFIDQMLTQPSVPAELSVFSAD